MRERFSAPVQTGPTAHPASCTMGTGSFPRVKSSLGVTLTPHPLLVPWSRKSRAIPLLPLWAVRPVQSRSACTRAHLFIYTLIVIIRDPRFRKEVDSACADCADLFHYVCLCHQVAQLNIAVDRIRSRRDFRHDLDEICALRGYYVARSVLGP